MTCFAALRFLARYFGRAVASVGLSTKFVRPDDPSPTLEELAARYGEEFQTGFLEVAGQERRGNS